MGREITPLALDFGANEVVRPFEYWWWKKIKSGKCKGSVVSVSLAAGHREAECVINREGELMIRGPENERQGWILPFCRMVGELGCRITLDPDRSLLAFPCGRAIVPTRHNNLDYVERNDLEWIREKLADSHLKGRRYWNGGPSVNFVMKDTSEPRTDDPGAETTHVVK